jgi:hypothetical protein
MVSSSQILRLFEDYWLAYVLEGMLGLLERLLVGL